ncbi:hypothetical protein Tco_1284934 [Tanacetum coccineum]
MGNNIPRLKEVKDYLGKCFSMKDLGEAAYILGIKIYRDRSLFNKGKIRGVCSNLSVDIKQKSRKRSTKGLSVKHILEVSEEILKYMFHSCSEKSRVQNSEVTGFSVHASWQCDTKMIQVSDGLVSMSSMEDIELEEQKADNHFARHANAIL